MPIILSQGGDSESGPNWGPHQIRRSTTFLCLLSKLFCCCTPASIAVHRLVGPGNGTMLTSHSQSICCCCSCTTLSAFLCWLFYLQGRQQHLSQVLVTTASIFGPCHTAHVASTDMMQMPHRCGHLDVAQNNCNQSEMYCARTTGMSLMNVTCDGLACFFLV